MLKVGARIECNLSGLDGREGLFTAHYPGTVEKVTEHGYIVALDDFVKHNEIRLEPFRCMSCGKKPKNGRRGFCSGKECAKCYVEDTVDRIFDLMEDREEETKRARPDVYESQRYNKAKRMAVASRAWIRHVGGTTQRKDERLRRNLVCAMERMDEMLEDHPDEAEYDL